MRYICSLLLVCWTMAAAGAQTLTPDAAANVEELLRRSVARVWWNRDLMAGGEYFRFAVNGQVIQNILPRFYATYETDAWVYDDAGHVVAYLGPAGSWMDHASVQLTVQTTDGQILPAKLVGIDEAEGVAVVQTEATAFRPVTTQLKIDWKPQSGLYVASLDKGFSLRACTVLNAERQAGLDEHKLRFKKLRLGRMGSMVFTREGDFAGFLTTVPKGPVTMQHPVVNLMPVEQILPSVQKIIQTGTGIRTGWLGLYLKDQPYPPPPGAAARGVAVRKVISGGPSARAGIAPNDIILKVNDIPVESLFHFVRVIQKSAVGSCLKLDILRGDKMLQLRPTVAPREELEIHPTYVVEVPQEPHRTVRLRLLDDIGVMQSRKAVFLGIYTSGSTELPKTRGLVITDVMENTPAAQADLRKGDVIVRVNDLAVENMDQYMAALMKNLSTPSIVFHCLREGQEIQKTISLK